MTSERRVFRDFTLTRVAYAAGTSLPPHAHEEAVLSFSVTGGTIVSHQRASEWCDRDAMLYLPAGADHANLYPRPATRLHVAVAARLWNEAAENRAIPSFGLVRHTIAHELRRAMDAAFDDADNLAGFDVTMSLTDTVGWLTSCRRVTARAMRTDDWLMRLRDFLIDQCSEPLTLGALTKVTGCHPVHISREFRLHFGKTITEFVRQRRLLRAARLLADDSLPLASIAIECGFYDQSHFSSAFRKYSGITPSAYRLRSRCGCSARGPAER